MNKVFNCLHTALLLLLLACLDIAVRLVQPQ